MGKLRLREDYILDGHALPDAGSHPEPINIVDPIMDLYFKFACTNGSESNIRNYIFDILNEIEVIDGSDVLFSLKPREILAMNAYHYKESMHWGINELPNAVQECVFKIPFGLDRYDPTIAFDPTKFKNPQIRFSWDLSNRRAKSPTTAFVTDTLAVDIVATIAEKFPVRPAGFLMHKHIQEWTTVGGGNVHRVEMPVDYAHRTVFLGLRDWYVDHTMAKCPWVLLPDAKYNVDQNKYIPFDWHTDDWMLWLKEFYGLWHQGMKFIPSGLPDANTTWRHLFLPANKSMAFLSKTAAIVWWWSQVTGCKIYISGATGTTDQVQVKIDGALPFNTWAYPFGDPGDMEEWLQVGDIGKIYFEITEGALAEDKDERARVCLTQYRPY